MKTHLGDGWNDWTACGVANHKGTKVVQNMALVTCGRCINTRDFQAVNAKVFRKMILALP